VALLAFTHAIIDFSLQIPGYAITAFAIMGAGLAQSFSTAKTPLYGPDSNFNTGSPKWPNS
jgi:hypothetical protein